MDFSIWLFYSLIGNAVKDEVENKDIANEKDFAEDIPVDDNENEDEEKDFAEMALNDVEEQKDEKKGNKHF